MRGEQNFKSQRLGTRLLFVSRTLPDLCRRVDHMPQIHTISVFLVNYRKAEGRAGLLHSHPVPRGAGEDGEDEGEGGPHSRPYGRGASGVW